MSYHIDTKRQLTIIEKSFSPELAKKLSEVNAFIAGGAISSLFTERPINDFDIFFESMEELIIINDYMEKRSNWESVYTSPCAKTFQTECKTNFLNRDPLDYGQTFIDKKKMKVQLVNMWLGDVQTIFDTFDFHCCMGAFVFKTQEFVFDRYFIGDNMSKKLRYNYAGNANALSTMLRIKKYEGYGYKIQFEELLKIILSIRKMKLDTMGDLKRFLKMLPPGMYKSILLKQLINIPLEAAINKTRGFAHPEGKQAYADFMGKAVDFDSVVNIISDLDSFIPDTHDLPAKMELPSTDIKF